MTVKPPKNQFQTALIEFENVRGFLSPETEVTIRTLLIAEARKFEMMKPKPPAPQPNPNMAELEAVTKAIKESGFHCTEAEAEQLATIALEAAQAIKGKRVPK